MVRRLSAVLSADIAGYSRLIERDESEALARVKRAFDLTFAAQVSAHGGRIVKLMGDGALVEFASAVDAVACAIRIQEQIATLDLDRPEDERIRFRLGVNLGDVVAEGDDIFGEGVIIAARLQGLARPGGIALSRTVREQVLGKVTATFEDMGEIAVKNIARPVHVFSLHGLEAGAGEFRRQPDQRVSICVLPFANMSGDPEQEYFSAGVTEDIITELSRISALKVTPRATAFSFKTRPSSLLEVAQRLRVSFVLEGSVRKSGDRLRISAQLIDVAADANIWAERFDRRLEDIFAVQAELATSIAHALKLQLLPNEKAALAEQKPAVNPEAYKLFLMARQSSVNGSERHEPIVARLCRRAVEIDPAYAPAWALLGATLTRMYRRGASDDDGEAAATRALELDGSLALAHAALSRIFGDRGRLEEACREDERGLSIDPDCYEARVSAGRNCILVRRHREALAHFERAAELIETEYVASAMQVQCHQAMGDLASAQDAARRAMVRIERLIASEPDHGSAMGHGAGALALLGEVGRAKEWAERAILLDPENTNLQYNLACAMALAGEHDTAIDYLQTLYSNADVRMELIRWAEHDNDLDPLRSHPRFVALMESVRERFAKA